MRCQVRRSVVRNVERVEEREPADRVRRGKLEEQGGGGGGSLKGNPRERDDEEGR